MGTVLKYKDALFAPSFFFSLFFFFTKLTPFTLSVGCIFHMSNKKNEKTDKHHWGTTSTPWYA